MRNEDWAHLETNHGFAIVADGMGGLQAGQIASRTAVERTIDALIASPKLDVDTLESALKLAHEAVQAKAKGLDLLGRMGSTLVIWAVTPGGCVCSHIGDSRAYRIRGGRIEQFTKDQSLAQRLIDLGLSENDEETRAHNAHILTQAIGLPGDFEPESITIDSEYERYLLCSDGLSDMVDDARICELMQIPDLETCSDELIKAALDRGGRDNVSVVLIEP